ncbi:MAG: tetratricopeptide repeat protein [Planctomycetaceae bacterium]|nr:tetratricopeptide repeat protein [Planctomycetaceae bacterium]
MTHAATLQIALDHHQSGRFPQAEQLYRQILAEDPNFHEAWHLLGLMAHQLGQNPAAIDLIGKAVQLLPNSALYYSNLGLAWEALGQSDKALYCYSRAVDIDPNFPEAHNNLGILLQTLGRLPEAVVSAQRAVQLRPNYPEALNNLASIYHSQGRLADAERTYRDALRLSPAQPQIHTNLGSVFVEQGRHDEAECEFAAALAIDANFAPAVSSRGSLLRKQKRFDEALACFEHAIRIQPQHPLGYCNLGVVLVDLGRDDEALAAYQRALELDPNHADTLNNLSNLLAQHGRFIEAEDAIRRALTVRPQSTIFLSNLGKVQQSQGHFEAARQSFLQALSIDPQNLAARCNLGVTLYELKLPREALRCFDQALSQQPDLVPALTNRATVFADQGEFDEALRAYQRAQELAPNDGRRVRIALLTHVLYESVDQMRAERTRITEAVASLAQEKLHVTDPVQDPGSTTFHLSYHAQNERELLTSIAALHRRAAPGLTFVAPHVSSPVVKTPGEKPRVGIISRYLHDHPVGLHYAGVIEQLPRDLHVSVFTFGSRDDAVTQQIRRRADEFVVLPTHLAACQQQLAQRQLDVLLYADIGMDPLTYFLAFSRLARVQAVAAGHPVTSGIDTLDYFLSSELLETPQSDGHYSERLVRFRSLPNRFTTPPTPPAKSRRDFGLPEGVPLYTCAQTLFKIHPDFDVVVNRLLTADADARVVFFADEQRLWAARLQQRLERQLGERMRRILWLPRQQLPDFRAALAVSDVILDTPHFSGGTTSLEALAVGAPVVTWPGQFMRGRVTYALYQKMGFTDLIATKVDNYLQLAQRLAHDRVWRAEIVAKLEPQRGVLFDNDEYAHELAGWLSEQARR